jgi:hypothetical protein
MQRLLLLLWSDEPVDSEIVLFAWTQWREQVTGKAAVLGVTPFNPLLLPAVAAEMELGGPASDHGELNLRGGWGERSSGRHGKGGGWSMLWGGGVFCAGHALPWALPLQCFGIVAACGWWYMYSYHMFFYRLANSLCLHPDKGGAMTSKANNCIFR